MGKIFDINSIKTPLKLKYFNKNISTPPMRYFGGDEKYKGRYELDFDMYLESYGVNLQRPLCWTELQKQELILSILKENPIPPVALVQNDVNEKKSVFKVIDGKQRFSSIIEFITNKFPIPCNNELFYFDELPKEIKFDIGDFHFIANIAYDDDGDAKISDDTLIQWFKLINFAGTEQEKSHIDNLTNLLKK
jgi:hypothetical protein